MTTSPAIAALPARTRMPLLVATTVVGALGLGVATAISPVLGLSLLAVLGGAWGFSRSGTFAVCAFVAVTYFEVLASYTGMFLSPIKLAGAALIVVALLALAGGGRTLRPAWRAHPMTMAMLATLVCLGFASVAWAPNLGELGYAQMRLVVDALVFLAVPVFLHRAGQLTALAWTALLAAAAATLLGNGMHLALLGRALGTFTDPNEFAAAIAPAMVLGYAAVALARTRTTRFVALGALGVCTFGLVASQSRGGLVSIVVAAIVLALTARGRERMRLVGGLLVAVAATAFFLAVTPSGQQTLQRFANPDSSGRVDLWRVAVQEFEHHPLTGVGLGNYPVVAAQYVTADVQRTDLVVSAPRTTHNVPLEIAAELGAPGLLAFYGFLLGVALVLWRAVRAARRAGDARTQVLGRVLLASLACLLTAGMFLSAQYQELLWVLLGASLSYAGVVRQRAAGRAQTEADVATIAAQHAA